MKTDFRRAKWSVDDDGKIVCSDQCPNYRIAIIAVDGDTKQSRLCRCNGHYKDAPFRIDKDCGRAFSQQETVDMETDANVRRLHELAATVPKQVFDRALRGLVAMWNATKKRAMTRADLFALAGDAETSVEPILPAKVDDDAKWLNRKEALVKFGIGHYALKDMVENGEVEVAGDGPTRRYRKKP